MTDHLHDQRILGKGYKFIFQKWNLNCNRQEELQVQGKEQERRKRKKIVKVTAGGGVQWSGRINIEVLLPPQEPTGGKKCLTRSATVSFSLFRRHRHSLTINVQLPSYEPSSFRNCISNIHSQNLSRCLFLGSFAKLRNATSSVVMSVRQRKNNSGSHRTDFHEV